MVDKKIRHKIDLGRVAGPYKTPTLDNFKSSPLNVTNVNISKDASSGHYATITDAINLIQKILP